MAKKSTVSCGRFLDIAHVADLKKRISTAFEKNPEVLSMTADQVERVDSAGLQLLLSTWVKCNKLNLEFKLTKPSDVLLNTGKLLGMHDPLFC